MTKPGKTLTKAERDILQRAFQFGPAVLFEEGWTIAKVTDFIGRLDVKAEWDLLQSEYNNQDPLMARTRFFAKRKLTRLAPDALSILERTLAGPVYARDRSGNILKDATGKPIIRQCPPECSQREAASEVLDRLGVGTPGAIEKGIMDRAADVNVNLLFRKGTEVEVTVQQDQSVSEEERALSRERVRTAIELLTKRLPQAKQKAEQRLSGPKNRNKKPSPDVPVNSTVSIPAATTE
jgi:hypothetical protein